MAKTELPPPKPRKGLSAKELAADAPDADKAPAHTEPGEGDIPPLQKITGRWPVNNF